MTQIRTWIFVILKDLSVFTFYFILMRFNLTHETYTKDMMSSFPEAPRMTFSRMLFASVYITWLPLIVDFAVVSIIQSLLSNRATKNKLWIFAFGILIHIPIILFWLVMNTIGSVNINTALMVSLIASVVFAGLIWMVLNMKTKTLIENSL